MGFKRKFKVEKIADTVVDKAGEEELQNKRTVVLNSEGLSMALTGYPGELTGFVTGDTLEIQMRATQTKLAAEEEEVLEKVREGNE
ncbi:unnamed protein product [marine sediment metagenome]|uniref:Uncharacterized protein n=1 Tax=marine sediment metagenome TaxID=412755 RepID=X1EXZ9_9ZZZZ